MTNEYDANRALHKLATRTSDAWMKPAPRKHRLAQPVRPAFYWALVACGVLVMASFCTQAKADEWTGADKRGHLAAGSLIGAFAGPRIGFPLGVTAALAKEAWDSKHPGHTPSYKDFAVTSIGAYVATRAPGLVFTPRAVWYYREF